MGLPILNGDVALVTLGQNEQGMHQTIMSLILTVFQNIEQFPVSEVHIGHLDQVMHTQLGVIHIVIVVLGEVAIGVSPDGEGLEEHVVAGQSAGLVSEDVLDLA